MTTLDDDARAALFAIGARGGSRFGSPGDLFESIIEDIYTGVLEQGDVAIDGGAHVGRHTFPMAERVGPGGTVFAVEPLRRLAQRLIRKARKQRASQVRIVQAALYADIRRITFHHVREHPAYSGIARRRYDFAEVVDVIEVDTVTIDSLLMPDLRQVPGRWRFCKLDLEGGELAALRGARRTLAAFRPLIVFENDQELSAASYGYSKEDWFGFFESIGYEVFNLWGVPYGRGDWGRRDIPWYFIAAPSGSRDASFVRDGLPDLLRKYLDPA